MVINWNEIAGKWNQLGGEVKKQWGKLTDDDLDVIVETSLAWEKKLLEKSAQD